MKTLFKRAAAVFLAVLMIITALPLTLNAACAHTAKTRTYSYENATHHSYKSDCTACGARGLTGYGLSGWEMHTFSGGRCTKCGYVCGHASTEKTYRYENGNQHSYTSTCTNCGKTGLTGYGYSGWSAHSFVSDTCADCGYKKTCAHSNWHYVYSGAVSDGHTQTKHCDDCGIEYGAVSASHAYTYGSWSQSSESAHERTGTCACGKTTRETESHSYSGGICVSCGYRKAVPDPASVSLSAAGPSGTLGSGGGEISSESCPAGYTVTAHAVNCTVTKISYTMNGRVYTVQGSTVTVRAEAESDFQTSTFTAFTDVPGVTATFTVNFKYVKKGSAAIMWETFDTATIRRITGNGLDKTLSYSMLLPTSYNSQSNLTEAQKEILQGLIGRNDGRTYMINYTRMIRVYTPPEFSSTGEKIIRAVYDGNNSAEITECIGTWGWTEGTKSAIRQAAASVLSFTTGIPVDCTAVWILEETGEELYRTTSFSGGKSVTVSSSTTVSIAYADYPGAASYIFSRLTFSGDTTGMNKTGTYSQIYTALSKPLTVKFYCQKKAADGTVTVRAVDDRTDELIPSAVITCTGKEMTENPAVFENLPFGTYTAGARADGYKSADAPVSISQTDRQKTVTLRLKKTAGSLEILVRDAETGLPITGADTSAPPFSGKTDENGRAYTASIAFGTYTVTAVADGYMPGSARVVIREEEPDGHAVIDLTPYPRRGSVSVRVIDAASGSALPGAQILGAGRSLTAGDAGTAVFGDLAFGSYSFTAAYEGYAPGSGSASITRTAPAAELTIPLTKLPETGTIRVKVIDAYTGSPVSGASVSGAGAVKTTGSTGIVTFSDILPGTYPFSVSKTHYDPASARAVLERPAEIVDITVALTPRGAVTVYVRDRVTDELLSGVSVSGAGTGGVTGLYGGLRFSSLAMGTYSFEASKAGYRTASGSATVSYAGDEEVLTLYLDKNLAEIGITANPVNGTVYRGSEIMVSAAVHNRSSTAFSNTLPLSVEMTAKRADGSVIARMRKNVICPPRESNLVWFALSIPESGAGSITVTYTVTLPAGYTDSDPSDNTAEKTVTPTVLPARMSPATSLELTPPAGYSGSVYKRTDAPIRSWTVWEWHSGFVKTTYRAELTVSAALTPDATAVWKQYQAGTRLYTTRSGYGLDTVVGVSCTGVPRDMLAGHAKVNAFYPEYNYSADTGLSDMLECTGENTGGYTAAFTFAPNGSTVGGGRMHKSPVWFPDGEYSVKYEVYDLWTPAGSLTGTSYAVVNIEGSMYDDYYTNRG